MLTRRTLALALLLPMSGCTTESGLPDLATAPDRPVATTAAAAAAPTFLQVSAGNNYSCGIATGGRAYCWGRGILGDGSSGFQASPVAVAGGLTFIQLHAGTTHTCGLTAEGRVYCWGMNDLGQLGTGNWPTGSATPVRIAGNRRFTQVHVGYRHSCALTAAGVAFCWGESQFGQLGLGTATGPEDCAGVPCSTTPVRVPGTREWRQIRPGGEHTCALDSARRYFCWGNNIFGQIGDGTRKVRLSPVQVTGFLFAQVSAGGMHTCGVTPENVAYCWGRNETGQLGEGTVTRRLRPRKVLGGLRFAGVTAGVEHSCGVTTSRQAWCWGRNSEGQLGDGTTMQRHVPAAVSGGLVWKSVEAGWFPSCGVTSEDKAYCWGQDGVGDGTIERRTSPAPVAAPM